MASMTQGTPLAGSVGTGGRNKPIDVAEVEYLLRQSAPDPVVIDIDGVAGPDLLTGIVDFQTRTMGQADPSGIIKPRDGVARQLSSSRGSGTVPIEAIRAMVPNDVDMQAGRVGQFTALYARQYGAVPAGLFQFFIFVANDQRIQDLRWFAYFLATCRWETAHKFLPIRETGQGAGRKYGKPTPFKDKTGRPFANVYYGRGYVQLTWLDNYKLMDHRLELGEMLEQEPDKAMDPPLAYRILSIGVREGLFGSQYVQSPPPGHPHAKRTAHGYRIPAKLGDFIVGGQCDYYRARLCVNPYDTNSFTPIAKMAVEMEVLLKLCILQSMTD